PLDFKLAIDNFERATQIQPDFAAAYAGLSVAWHIRAFVSFVTHAEAEGPQRKSALKAMELDPNLAEAHLAMAGLLWDNWQWAAADKEYQKALELNPGSLETCRCYTVFLASVGRVSDAIAMAERGITINPLSSATQGLRGYALYLAG